MSKKNIIGLFLLVFILSTTSATAIEYNLNCSGGVLYKNASLNINGSSFTVNQNISCGTLGCANNAIECLSPQNIPTEIYMSMVLALSLLAFVFAFVAVKMSEDHWPISILFLLATLLMALMCISLLMGFSTQTQDSMAESLVNVFTLIFYSFMLFMVYIIINIMYEALIKKPKKNEEDV